MGNFGPLGSFLILPVDENDGLVAPTNSITTCHLLYRVINHSRVVW